MDKKTRRENMGKNLKRQLKGLIKSEDNLLNAVGLFAIGLIMLAAAVVSGKVFFGLVGAACLVLGLGRILSRGRNSGEAAGDLSTRDTNRENK